MKALKLGASGPYVDSSHCWIERPQEARIRMVLGGVCATDLELIRGYMGFEGVLGHEWVGVVESSKRPELKGRRVVGDINCPCGSCAACSKEMGNHCPERTVLGIMGRDGAFADYFSLPEANLHLVPDNVTNEQAVFVEPLAAAIRILQQHHVSPTDRVMVMGLGRLGQLCARVLALTGAKVLGVARRPDSLAMLTDGIEGALVKDLMGQPVAMDVVVDCTGSPEGLHTAQSFLRPGGTLILKSTTHDLPETIRPSSWVIDELRIVGSRCGPFDAALRLLGTGAVDPSVLITDRIPLQHGVKALERAQQADAMKVLIAPE